MLKNFTLLISLLVLFSACSTKEKVIYKPQTKNNRTQALYKEFKKWGNVPYKYGGNSLTNGIDCSGYTKVIFKNVFNKKIPRTTTQQAKIGYKVSQKDIKVGDIVIFKTGRNVKHSGIVIEGNRFIHSGTSTGVIISSLSNPYWKSHYWQTRRVLK